jgi:hypothetical protein
MADHVEVNGIPMWYDQRGDGDPLVLLHGGLTDSRDFTGNLDTLASRFRLLLPVSLASAMGPGSCHDLGTTWPGQRAWWSPFLMSMEVPAVGFCRRR